MSLAHMWCTILIGAVFIIFCESSQARECDELTGGLADGITRCPTVTTDSLGSHCPDINEVGEVKLRDSDQLYTQETVYILAGGDINLDDCSYLGVTGHVAKSPDISLVFQNLSNLSLSISVIGDCDTILLANDTEGDWLYNDDHNNSSDSRLYFEFADSGLYDIWIGTFDENTCDSVLVLETF
ncbi:MAG: hypothetical protein OEU26_15875 [Candidatus Tectomicrobia bacterium]|nr:hypothetical protein [Candidatus Tectomicrobia bacterium]